MEAIRERQQVRERRGRGREDKREKKKNNYNKGMHIEYTSKSTIIGKLYSSSTCTYIYIHVVLIVCRRHYKAVFVQVWLPTYMYMCVLSCAM